MNTINDKTKPESNSYNEIVEIKIKKKRGRKPLYLKKITVEPVKLIYTLFMLYDKKYIIYINSTNDLIDAYLKVKDETKDIDLNYTLYNYPYSIDNKIIINDDDCKYIDLLERFAKQYYKYYINSHSKEDENNKIILFVNDYNNMIKESEKLESYYRNVRKLLTINIFE